MYTGPLLYYVLTNKDEDTQLWPRKLKWKTILFGGQMGAFCCFSFKSTMVGYIDYLGWELITILVGSYTNINDFSHTELITAWGLFQNIATLGPYFGMGFGQACYHYIGTL